jgi:ribose transport system ATP-binding protein
MAQPPLLEVSGVSKGFPGVQALEDVHFELNAGEVHALVGENGAGKSTLMKILSGIYKRDTGVVKLNGAEVEVSDPYHAQMSGISIIHQEMNLMPHLTVAQNILIGREPKIAKFFLSERELNKKAQALLDELGLALNTKEVVENLTVAKQQMVEIAKALSYNSDIIIMDEPTSALTRAETESLFEIIKNLKDSGKGVIYISHRMEELTQISDRITVLRDGRYIDTLETKSTEIGKIISLMVGREVDHNARPELVKKDGNDIVLKVEGLSTRRLLQNVTFDLRKGEILGFAGLMGAGRTEVALAMIGRDKMQAGKIFIEGKEVKIKNPAQAVAAGIGYLSEDRKRFGLLLAQDVVFNTVLSSVRKFVNSLGVFNKLKAKRQTELSIDSLQIKTPSSSQTVKNLSGGNQQKVVIAKWLTRECDILIFDEPTRGIDVGAKEEIYRLLNDLSRQGKSIIMISSELPEVLRLSDRIVVMCEGRVTGVLDNGDANQENIMQLATKFRV